MSYLELIDELRKVDEVTLLELLDIEADDLVDMFGDKIKERIDYIRKYLYDK